MPKIEVSFLSLFLLLAACAPVPISAPSSSSYDKLAEIQARGTLVIATDADYPPQSQLLPDIAPDPNTKCAPTQYTANQMAGFDVDVAIKVAGYLGVEPCFVTPPWSQLIAGKWGDNWDIHAGSVAITLDRMERLYFSQPYFATPLVILIHKDNQTYKVPEDLSGKRIGVCAGCTFEAYLKGTLQLPGQKIEYRIHDARIVGYENEAPAIKDLAEGDGVKLDAVMTILPLARNALEAGEPLKIMEGTLFYTYASITLDRSSQRDPARLLAEISQCIQEMHADGTLSRYSTRYLGIDLTQEAARFDLSALGQPPAP